MPHFNNILQIQLQELNPQSRVTTCPVCGSSKYLIDQVILIT